MHSVAAMAVTSKCPWCKNVMASKAICKNHLTIALDIGHCGSGGRIPVHDPIVDFQCSQCNVECADEDEYSLHVIICATRSR